MATILVLHGPNLNLLGQREPDIYGHLTLDEINTKLKMATSHSLDIRQSNAEHVLIDAIHEAARNRIPVIIFNPAAFTHTSVALRDALLATRIPFFEVHLSDRQARETFRQHSYFADIAEAEFQGHGVNSYLQALAAAEKLLTTIDKLPSLAKRNAQQTLSNHEE